MKREKFLEILEYLDGRGLVITDDTLIEESLKAFPDSFEDKKEYFTITTIHREDLAGVIGEEKANAFTDSDMKHLASKMSDDYLNQLYWESMKTIVEFLIEDGCLSIKENNTNKKE